MKRQKKNGIRCMALRIQDDKQSLTKKQSSNNRGITLVALVVSIVVMLVLAGVSINAVVGDNGIITQAQSATYATSRAVLEEWINQLYVENYDEFSEYDNKVEALMTKYSEYFYSPKKDSGVGSLDYIIDSEDHALYLIKKSALPDEIKGQLTGGDAEDGSYASYFQLLDVYGVTSDLKVYYCSNGTDTLLGITTDELDNENPDRDVTISNALANALGTDTTVTARELKKVKELSIDSDCELSSLSELYILTSLQKLTLDNKAISLEGLQNCTQLTQLYFQNYTSDTITNYTALSKLTKLQYLYLIKSCDSQVSNVFTNMKNTDYSNLQYLGIYNGTTNVTSIATLTDLTTNTKQAVNYLYLYSNNLTSLESLSGFSKVIYLNVSNNSNLTTLKGINQMTQLISLYANNCNLGYDEVYDASLENYGKNSNEDAIASLSNMTSLVTVYLYNNANLKWIGYLSNCSKITTLLLSGCTSMVNTEVSLIRDVYLACSLDNRSIPSKYQVLLNTDTEIDYRNLDLEDSDDEIAALLNNTKCTTLYLDNNSELTNDRLQTILTSMTGIVTLRLNGLTKLTSISFVSKMPNLKYLYLDDTSVTDVSILEDLELKFSVLSMNNSSITLSDIQTVITNSTLYISNGTLAEKLSTCINITKLDLRGTSGGKTTYTNEVDLSKCTSLTNVYFSNTQYKFKLPSSVTTVNMGYNNVVPDVSQCKLITQYTTADFYYSSDDFSTLMTQLSADGGLISISMHYYKGESKSIPNLDLLSSCTSLTTFDFGSNTGCAGELESISGIEKITSLTKIIFSANALIEIPDLSKLSNLEYLDLSYNLIEDLEFLSSNTNLETLILNTNNIIELHGIESLTKLSYMDLQNNLITSDTLSYIDTNGDTVKYKNLQILANLNETGGLKTLYLSGNNYITDYSLISGLSWTAKDF